MEQCCARAASCRSLHQIRNRICGPAYLARPIPDPSRLRALALASRLCPARPPGCRCPAQLEPSPVGIRRSVDPLLLVAHYSSRLGLVGSVSSACSPRRPRSATGMRVPAARGHRRRGNRGELTVGGTASPVPPVHAHYLAARCLLRDPGFGFQPTAKESRRLDVAADDSM